MIIGEPGSGKTTQLPKILFEHFAREGMVGVTQPRRVAATSVARRVAEEMQCEIGKKVRICDLKHPPKD